MEIKRTNILFYPMQMTGTTQKLNNISKHLQRGEASLNKIRTR